MAAASVHTDDLLEPPLAVTPEGLELRNPASGWLLAAAAACLALGATVGVAIAVPPELSARNLLFAAVLTAAAAVAAGLRMKVDGSNFQSAPREPMIVCAAIVLGPAFAAVVAACAGARLLPSPRSAAVYYAGAGALQGVVVGLAAHFVLAAAPDVNVLVVSTAAALVAGAAWFAARELVCVVRRVPTRAPVLPGVAAETLITVALSPALILLFRESGVAAASVFVIVVVGGFAAFRTYRDRLLSLQNAVEQLARTDSLTGAANRRAFDERLLHELRRSARSGHGLGVILIDPDRFKQVNDSYGHRAGDLVLAEVSRRLAGRLRDSDLLARFGGDEFAAIVVDVDDASELELLVDDLCRAVRESPVNAAGPIPVTVSVGAALSIAPSTPESVLASADAALYAAKADGRDCGRVAGVRPS